MILHLSEITKGMLQDVVKDYKLNFLKLLWKSSHCFYFKKNIC